MELGVRIQIFIDFVDSYQYVIQKNVLSVLVKVIHEVVQLRKETALYSSVVEMEWTAVGQVIVR